MGIGAQEILIIGVIVVLLFGAPILTFLLGYVVGRKRSQDVAREAPTVPATKPPSKEQPFDE
jgi:Sec-independent protein translocase protein TatA